MKCRSNAVFFAEFEASQMRVYFGAIPDDWPYVTEYLIRKSIVLSWFFGRDSSWYLWSSPLYPLCAVWSIVPFAVFTPFRAKDNSFQTQLRPTESKIDGKYEVGAIRS